MSLFSAVIFSPVSVTLEESQPLSPASDPSLPHGFKIWLKEAKAEIKGFQRLKQIGRGITPGARPLPSVQNRYRHNNFCALKAYGYLDPLTLLTQFVSAVRDFMVRILTCSSAGRITYTHNL